MSLILNIETATDVCSVCIAENGRLISLRETQQKNAHASSITPFIDEVISEAHRTIDELDAIAVSSGPGSYTGLRIGVSTAKGLCLALGAPLISVSTLQAMAFRMAEINNGEKCLYCPMIDARRMEVYAGIYDADNKAIEPPHSVMIDHDSFATVLVRNKIIFFGSGSAKCKGIINNPRASFYDGFTVSSSHLCTLSAKAYSEKRFEELAYFEPLYLKKIIAD